MIPLKSFATFNPLATSGPSALSYSANVGLHGMIHQGTPKEEKKVPSEVGDPRKNSLSSRDITFQKVNWIDEGPTKSKHDAST